MFFSVWESWLQHWRTKFIKSKVASLKYSRQTWRLNRVIGSWYRLCQDSPGFKTLFDYHEDTIKTTQKRSFTFTVSSLVPPFSVTCWSLDSLEKYSAIMTIATAMKRISKATTIKLLLHRLRRCFVFFSGGRNPTVLELEGNGTFFTGGSSRYK